MSAGHLGSFLASADTKPETKSSNAPTPATPANGNKKQLMTSHSVASGKTETTLLQPSTPPIHETNLVNSHDSTKNNVGPAGDWKSFGFPIQISRIQENIHKEEVNCLNVKMKKIACLPNTALPVLLLLFYIDVAYREQEVHRCWKFSSADGQI